VNARNKSKSTALHEAAGVGNLDITKLLLSHGAEVNAFDRWGDSPIHTASRFQKIDVVELLVKNGANVNVRERRSNNRVPGDNMNDGSRYTWMVTAVATVAVVVTAVVNRYR